MKKTVFLFLTALVIVTFQSCHQNDLKPANELSEVIVANGEKVKLTKVELTTAENLLKNEDFKNWLSINDELRVAIFSKLKNMNNDERKAIIKKYASRNDETAFRDFCLEFILSENYENLKQKEIKIFENFALNRHIFQNASINVIKYVYFQRQFANKARVEDAGMIQQCDTSYTSCETGVSHVVTALIWAGASDALISKVEGEGLKGCWLDAVACLNGGAR